jgi:hypothetical protein
MYWAAVEANSTGIFAIPLAVPQAGFIHQNYILERNAFAQRVIDENTQNQPYYSKPIFKEPP